MSAPKSVLVLRPGALGDAVLTLPVLRSLLAAGTQQITIIGRPSSWAFLPERHKIKILDWDSPGWMGLFSPGIGFPSEIQNQLKQTDLAIVYLKPDGGEVEHALRSAGVKDVVRCTPPLMDETGTAHATERLMEPLEAVFGVGNWGVTHDYREWLDVGDIPDIFKRYFFLDQPFFLLHPGSGGKKKCWPVEKFVRLGCRIHQETGWLPVKILGPADKDLAANWEGAVFDLEPEAKKVFRDVSLQLVNQPLKEILAIAAHSKLYVGNDSGITHLASLVSPQTFALFGPTDPRVWRSLGPNVTVLRADEHALAPMDQLSEEKVFEAIRRA